MISTREPARLTAMAFTWARSSSSSRSIDGSWPPGAAEAAPGGQLPSMLRDELLERAQVKAIAVKRAGSRVLIIEMDMPAEVDASFDLQDASWFTLIKDALAVYLAPDDRVI